MTELITRLVQGISVWCLASGILQCIRKSVPEHGLQQMNTQQFNIFFFIGGFCLCPDRWIISVFLIIFIACIGAMAYTDFYTRQVYIFFYVIVALVGYGKMVLHGEWASMGQIFIFILLVLAGSWLRAYTMGDAEIFIAAAPFITLIAERNGIDVLFFLIVYYWMSMVLWPINWLFYTIAKRKLEMKFPMVPFMYAALIILLCMENIL